MLGKVQAVIRDGNLKHATHLKLQRDWSGFHIVKEICIQGNLFMALDLNIPTAFGTLKIVFDRDGLINP